MPSFDIKYASLNTLGKYRIILIFIEGRID